MLTTEALIAERPKKKASARRRSRRRRRHGRQGGMGGMGGDEDF